MACGPVAVLSAMVNAAIGGTEKGGDLPLKTRLCAENV